MIAINPGGGLVCDSSQVGPTLSWVRNFQVARVCHVRMFIICLADQGFQECIKGPILSIVTEDQSNNWISAHAWLCRGLLSMQ